MMAIAMTMVMAWPWALATAMAMGMTTIAMTMSKIMEASKPALTREWPRIKKIVLQHPLFQARARCTVRAGREGVPRMMPKELLDFGNRLCQIFSFSSRWASPGSRGI